jgi:hypothetical protein
LLVCAELGGRFAFLHGWGGIGLILFDVGLFPSR